MISNLVTTQFMYSVGTFTSKTRLEPMSLSSSHPQSFLTYRGPFYSGEEVVGFFSLLLAKKILVLLLLLLQNSTPQKIVHIDLPQKDFRASIKWFVLLLETFSFPNMQKCFLIILSVTKKHPWSDHFQLISYLYSYSQKWYPRLC